MPNPSDKWVAIPAGRTSPTPHRYLVIWTTDDDLSKGDFRIIHKGACDPRGRTASVDVADFLGVEEARRYFRREVIAPKFSSANEVWPYTALPSHPSARKFASSASGRGNV